MIALSLSLSLAAQVPTQNDLASTVSPAHHSNSPLKLPLRFEPNTGRYPADVNFVARQPHGEVMLSATEARIAFTGAAGSSLVSMQLVNARTDASVKGEQQLSGTTNYFIGNDPNRWQTEMPAYAQVRYRDVYPGVDLVFYGNDDSRLEHDFIIGPNASPDDIHLRIGGSPQVKLDRDGNLVLDGGFRLKRPVAYQDVNGERKYVASNYVVHGNDVSFAVARYDRSRTLVVDPVAYFNTPTIGGTSVDLGNSISVDNQGNMYVTGTTYSTDFPYPSTAQALPGGHSNCGVGGSYMLCGDAFVMKVDSSGNVVYFTYLGGAANDSGAAIAIDASGNAYITGSTQSTNFPIYNAAQTSNHGGGDAFVTKLNSSGKLVYSTYYGGSAADAGTAIAVTSTGVASVVGTAQSFNVPIAGQPFAPTCSMDPNHLCQEGFFAQYSATGALTYSGYLRGAGNAITLGSTGLAYVAGAANTNFVATWNAYRTTPGGATDGYLEQIDTTKSGSSSLPYATYLGTNGGSGTGVAVDNLAKVYLTTTAQQVAAVLKLDITKSGSGAKVFNTVLAAPAHTAAWSPVLDRSGNLFVVGQGLYKIFMKYYTSWYIAQLNPAGVATDYVTSQDALSYAGLAVDSLNTVYLVGTTYHSNPGDVMINRYAAGLPAVLTVYPNPTIFPKQVLTASPQANVNVVNHGGIAETISNVSVSSGFSQINNCTSVKLNPGIGCVFLITYNGKQPGVTTGTLTFTSTSYPSQHKVNLFVDAGMPKATVSPTSLAFGTVPIGQKVSKTVTLTNSGDGNYPLGLIIAPGLSELHDCGTVVRPNGNCHLTFTFAPTKLTDAPGTIVINPYPNGSTYLPVQTIITSGKAQ